MEIKESQGILRLGEKDQLLEKFNHLQEQINSKFNEEKKAEIDFVKNKLAKVIAKKTQGTIVGSRACMMV